MERFAKAVERRLEPGIRPEDVYDLLPMEAVMGLVARSLVRVLAVRRCQPRWAAPVRSLDRPPSSWMRSGPTARLWNPFPFVLERRLKAVGLGRGSGHLPPASVDGPSASVSVRVERPSDVVSGSRQLRPELIVRVTEVVETGYDNSRGQPARTCLTAWPSPGRLRPFPFGDPFSRIRHASVHPRSRQARSMAAA